MRLSTFITTIVLTSVLAVGAVAAPKQAAEVSPERQLLQRIYQMRMRIDQERMQSNNQARANVRLISGRQQGLNNGVDSPTVSGLRQQTNRQLARFESKFQCLDVKVEANSGNTVVICGDNTGDISGTNVSAQRDIVTVNGGMQ